ncbi:hypothetical protein EVG20_g1527 [Dentipellis fragilis]|uniref:Uncharacterized protein n=1 Tax=Dentipellis fragilis TaxID=205917 RepID=A0A4Y9Z9L2_9AGAM|nr:hypothetical protein EVG20_g1527 [Dentipellis fragilis]
MDPYANYSGGQPHMQNGQEHQHQNQHPHQQSIFTLPDNLPSSSQSQHFNSDFFMPMGPPPVPVENEQAVQLEILRETRRIREIELQIAEAGRQQSEEQRRQREAELAIAHFQSRTSAGSPTHSHSHAHPHPHPQAQMQLQMQMPMQAHPHQSQAQTQALGEWDAGMLADLSLAAQQALTASYPSEYTPVLDAAQAQFINSWFAEAPGAAPSARWSPSTAAEFHTVDPSASSSSHTPPATNSTQDSPGDESLPFADLERGEDIVEAAAASGSGAAAKKRAGKVVEPCDVVCHKCSTLMAKMLLRGTKEELEVPYDTVFTCLTCKPYTPTVPSRKRSMEMEDISSPATCDICQHVKGHGGFVPRRSVIAFTAEIMCLSCSDKYRRCTNCGGTSARGVIGKWRCKELFKGGRKTCSLSHARLGTRDMELVTCDVAADLVGKTELPEMLDHCEHMWREHVLSKLAVPEVLEHQNDLRTFQDIEQRYLKAGFPDKELFGKAPENPNHRRYITFSWAKARTRRDKTKPEWARHSSDSKQPDQWLTYNMRRSTVLFPTSSILVGVWLIEWNIPNRSMVVDTLSPFDSGAFDERGVIHTSEILRRALSDLMQHNSKHPEDKWSPPEHLWAVIMNTSWTTRLRISEGLLRRHFVPLEEYLARHTETRREMFSGSTCELAKVLALRRTKKGCQEPEVLVKFLGQELSLSGMQKFGAEQLKASIRRNR